MFTHRQVQLRFFVLTDALYDYLESGVQSCRKTLVGMRGMAADKIFSGSYYCVFVHSLIAEKSRLINSLTN